MNLINLFFINSCRSGISNKSHSCMLNVYLPNKIMHGYGVNYRGTDYLIVFRYVWDNLGSL